MKLLTNAMRRNPEYKAVSEAFAAGKLTACVTGVATVHKAHLISSLCEEHGRKAFVVVGDEAEGQRIHDDLTMMGMRCVVYPYRELSLARCGKQRREYEHQRLGALAQILDQTADAVICCIDAALELTIPPEELKARTASVSAGEQISMRRWNARCLPPAMNVQSRWRARGSFRTAAVFWISSRRVRPRRSEPSFGATKSIPSVFLTRKRSAEPIRPKPLRWRLPVRQ